MAKISRETDRQSLRDIAELRYELEIAMEKHSCFVLYSCSTEPKDLEEVGRV